MHGSLPPKAYWKAELPPGGWEPQTSPVAQGREAPGLTSRESPSPTKAAEVAGCLVGEATPLRGVCKPLREEALQQGGRRERIMLTLIHSRVLMTDILIPADACP